MFETTYNEAHYATIYRGLRDGQVEIKANQWWDETITLGHLRGVVTSEDGVCYASVSGEQIFEERFGTDENLAKGAVLRARWAVERELNSTKKRVMAQIEKDRAAHGLEPL